MFRNNRKPIVFAGASLSYLSGLLRTRLDLRPPARRGDLLRLLEQETKPCNVLLIDGVFSSSLSVSPTECRQLLEQGWTIVGAASMGALRASELWSVGMIGIGEIYSLLRLGVLRSDADVAVALNPNTHAELTASIVHIRALLEVLRHRGEISPQLSRILLRIARDIYFMERHWPVCIDRWREHGLSDAHASILSVLSADPRYHPKIRDAHLAVNTVLAKIWIEANVFDRENKIISASIPVASVERAGDENAKICPACNYRMPMSAIFCPDCASTAHEGSRQEYPQLTD